MKRFIMQAAAAVFGLAATLASAPVTPSTVDVRLASSASTWAWVFMVPSGP